ncbi:hypothetical protein [Neobacillus ginsengisoli]|uniref:Uncharacterized protein n=1 Tax=Neobacillus ginsengisoli TaxID=904295 RepID=A0ABT9XWH5_9BACI|nr:hypothetical protein [Neobacillus ginsengisoli]MDQ0199289.1 hypothetical protein [Neobacillus ginsengisoli]
MEIKGNITKIRIKWHTLRRNYFELLLDSCLDSIVKTKLKQKITYHTTRLIDLI